MNNGEVARVFQDISDLLELKGESLFKVRAYQKAVRSIEHLPVELSQLMAEGKLRDVPGIGEAIEKKITELLDTGHLKYYEELRAEFPEGVISLLQVPGVGPKTAMRLSTELGVKSIEDLEQAIIDGRGGRPVPHGRQDRREHPARPPVHAHQGTAHTHRRCSASGRGDHGFPAGTRGRAQPDAGREPAAFPGDDRGHRPAGHVPTTPKP